MNEQIVHQLVDIYLGILSLLARHPCNLARRRIAVTPILKVIPIRVFSDVFEQ
jgi:hypothetical protein